MGNNNKKEYHIYYHGKKQSGNNNNSGGGGGRDAVISVLVVLFVLYWVWEALEWCYTFVTNHWIIFSIIGFFIVLGFILNED